MRFIKAEVEAHAIVECRLSRKEFAMFEDSLLERGFIKSHRGRATIISFALQIVLLGTLGAMPFFRRGFANA